MLEDNGLIRNMLRSVTFDRNVLLSLFVNCPEYKMPVLEMQFSIPLKILMNHGKYARMKHGKIRKMLFVKIFISRLWMKWTKFAVVQQLLTK